MWYTLLAVRSVLRELKKLSVAELSQTSPARLMLQVMPWSSSCFWKCSLVYWADSTVRRNTFNQEVFMGRAAGWMTQLTGRGPMRSPGAPSLRREVERQFCAEIATGITSGKAAQAVGVSQAVGSRWFRHRGGMPLFMSKPVSDGYLSLAERGEIGLLRAQDLGVRVIARRIGRSPSPTYRGGVIKRYNWWR